MRRHKVKDEFIFMVSYYRKFVFLANLVVFMLIYNNIFILYKNYMIYFNKTDISFDLHATTK